MRGWSTVRKRASMPWWLQDFFLCLHSIRSETKLFRSFPFRGQNLFHEISASRKKTLKDCVLAPEAWDELKGRRTPISPQEFVDSKQRLRAALRNLKTIKDLPGDGQYRRYRISDIEDIRKKNECRVEETNVKPRKNSCSKERGLKEIGEVWASSLEIKQEEPTYFPEKKPMDLPKSGYLEAPHCSKTQAWDELKGRRTPISPQEFVDSKQRLRAALRNLKTIKDLPGDGQYRRYRISDNS